VLLQLVAAALRSGARPSAAAGLSTLFRRLVVGTLMAAVVTRRSCDVLAARIGQSCLLAAAVALDLLLRDAPTVAFESARRLSADVAWLLAALGADSVVESELRRIADAGIPARRGSVARGEDSEAPKMGASVPSGRMAARMKIRVGVRDPVLEKVARVLQLAAASDPNVGGLVASFARRRVGAMSLRCQLRVRIGLVQSGAAAVADLVQGWALRDGVALDGFVMTQPACAG